MKALLGVLFLSLPLVAGAQMYKCVDERGVTHYTEHPLPNCKGGKVGIQAIPPVGGQVKPGARDLQQQDRDFRRRRIEQEQAAQKEATRAARRCTQLRNEHARLSHAGRVFSLNSKGERVYLEDAERARRIEALQAEMRACP
jgi:hypothetical protein